MNKSLIIYDTSVLMHKIIPLDRDENNEIKYQLTNRARDKRLKDGINLYNTLFWVDNLHDLAKQGTIDVIWAGDSTSGYWRTREIKAWLNSLPPDAPQLTKRKGSRKGYKGNRNTCPYAQWVKKRINKISGCLYYPDYEADDIIAALVTILYDKYDKIYICTVDSDLIQLVNKKVNWCCMTGFSPAFRNIPNGIKWLEKMIAKESKKTQAAIDTNNLRDIVTWKALVGDKSDNLPANTPREFIDLLNPSKEEYKVWTHPEFLATYQDFIKPFTYDEGAFNYWVENYGFINTSSINIY